VIDTGPQCPECHYAADCCYACPACGHCDSLHGYDGVYCGWNSPNGLVCPCLLDRSRVMEAGIDRWPDDEDDEP
jgi:hypothetical protein